MTAIIGVAYVVNFKGQQRVFAAQPPWVLRTPKECETQVLDYVWLLRCSGVSTFTVKVTARRRQVDYPLNQAPKTMIRPTPRYERPHPLEWPLT